MTPSPSVERKLRVLAVIEVSAETQCIPIETAFYQACAALHQVSRLFPSYLAYRSFKHRHRNRAQHHISDIYAKWQEEPPVERIGRQTLDYEAVGRLAGIGTLERDERLEERRDEREAHLRMLPELRRKCRADQSFLDRVLMVYLQSLYEARR